MKRMNKWLSVIFVMALLYNMMAPAVIAAEKKANYRVKDEVIYGTLQANGTSESAYVVNVFEVIDAGEIIDFGPYTSVKNLTNVSELTNGTDQVKFTAEEGKFYYQGDLDNVQFPWDIEVTYYLDDKLIEPDELLGKDGSLEIKITTKENKDVQSVFFEHYTVQITVPFDVEKFSHIEAEDATIANAGKMQQVTFTALPEEETDVSVTAQVTDFELEGIDIVAIPFVMALDDFETDEMVDDMGELSDAISDVHEGVGKLNEGIRALRSGTGDLQAGSTQFQQGLTDLNEASGSLVHGSEQIKTALKTMQNEMSSVENIDISQLQEVTTGLSEMEAGLRETAEGLDEVASLYTQAYDALIEVVDAIPEQDASLSLTEEEIGLMLSEGISEEKVNYMMTHLQTSQTIKKMFSNSNEESIKPLFDQMENVLQQSSRGLNDIADGLQQMNSRLSESFQQFEELDQITELINGLNQFVTEYESFHDGLVEYTNGVEELTNAYRSIHDGISELATGTDELSTGSTELHDGTGELTKETATLPEDMQEEIDEFLKTYDHTDFEPISFVSEKNEPIGIVQFILKTNEIKYPEEAEEEQQVEEKKGFWEMIKGLFKRE